MPPYYRARRRRTFRNPFRRRQPRRRFQTASWRLLNNINTLANGNAFVATELMAHYDHFGDSTTLGLTVAQSVRTVEIGAIMFDSNIIGQTALIAASLTFAECYEVLCVANLTSAGLPSGVDYNWILTQPPVVVSTAATVQRTELDTPARVLWRRSYCLAQGQLTLANRLDPAPQLNTIAKRLRVRLGPRQGLYLIQFVQNGAAAAANFIGWAAGTLWWRATH